MATVVYDMIAADDSIMVNDLNTTNDRCMASGAHPTDDSIITSRLIMLTSLTDNFDIHANFTDDSNFG